MSIEPTVFLVDDDPAVRNAVCMCIEAAGMPVESFDSAEQLGVSHRTIEIHRSRIMKKIQAKSVAALVSMATLCGMRSEPLN